MALVKPPALDAMAQPKFDLASAETLAQFDKLCPEIMNHIFSDLFHPNAYVGVHGMIDLTIGDDGNTRRDKKRRIMEFPKIAHHPHFQDAFFKWLKVSFNARYFATRSQRGYLFLTLNLVPNKELLQCIQEAGFDFTSTPARPKLNNRPDPIRVLAGIGKRSVV